MKLSFLRIVLFWFGFSCIYVVFSDTEFVLQIHARRNFATYNNYKNNNEFLTVKKMSSNIEITRICQFCDNEFTARTTVTKYCSHRCASQAYKARQRGKDIAKSNQETTVTISAPIIELQAKDFLSVSDASALLGISRWTLSRAINDGRLNIVRFGKRIVIKRTEIDRLFS